MKKRVRLVMILAGGLVTAIGLAACASGSTPAPGSTANAACDNGSFTQAAVDQYLGSDYSVPVVYEPKCELKAKYNLIFLNPGQSIAYFKTWNDAMTNAAKFYGVEFSSVDLQLKFDNLVQQYNTIAIKNPDVVGTLGPVNEALIEPAKADGIKYLPIGPVLPDNPYSYGGQDERREGIAGGEYLASAVAEKLKGDWQGRENLLVLIRDASDVPQTKTLEGGREGFEQTIKTSTVLNVTVPACLPDEAGQIMRDVLTANPDSTFSILVCNEAVGVAAFRAIQEAGRTADVQLVTYGGDPQGADAMRTDTDGAYIGMVDVNPYAQGWNWVAAAIAIAEGDTPKVYSDVIEYNIIRQEDVK